MPPKRIFRRRYRRSSYVPRRNVRGYRRFSRVSRYRSIFSRQRAHQVSYFKFRAVVDFTTGGTNGDASLALAYNNSLSTSGSDSSSIATYADTTPTYTALQDASVVDSSSFYEYRRVAGIRIQWIPAVPDDASTVTSYQPMYMTKDLTGIDTAPASSMAVSDFLQEDKVVVKNMFRPWKVYYPAMKFKVNSRYPGFSSSAGVSQNNAGSWTNPGAPPTSFTSSRSAHIIVGIRGATTSKTYGKFLLTYYCVFKDRT